MTQTGISISPTLVAFLQRVNYNMTQTIRACLPVGKLRNLFENDPELLAEARVFALDIMRYRDSGIFRRFHSSRLADEVFEFHKSLAATACSPTSRLPANVTDSHLLLGQHAPT